MLEVVLSAKPRWAVCVIKSILLVLTCWIFMIDLGFAVVDKPLVQFVWGGGVAAQ